MTWWGSCEDTHAHFGHCAFSRFCTAVSASCRVSSVREPHPLPADPPRAAKRAERVRFSSSFFFFPCPEPHVLPLPPVTMVRGRPPPEELQARSPFAETIGVSGGCAPRLRQLSVMTSLPAGVSSSTALLCMDMVGDF